MRQRPTRRTAVAYAAQLLGLAVIYVLSGRLGLVMASERRVAVWAPTGIALAAVFLGGYRLWPGVALGALATHVWMGTRPLVAVVTALGSTVEAVVAVHVLRDILGFRASFDRFADVVGLAVVTVGSAALGATLGSAILVLGGGAPLGFARTWPMWWTGEILGGLVVAPLLLTWAQEPRVTVRPAVVVEATALGALLVGCAALVFGHRTGSATEAVVLRPYLLMPALLWAAIRFGTRGAATAMFVTTVAAIGGTCAGRGTFAHGDWGDGLIALPALLAALSLGLLTVAAVVSERKSAELTRAWLAAIVESSAEAIVGEALDGTVSSWNAAAERLYGYRRDEVIGKGIVMLVPPEERDELAWLLDRVRRGERVESHDTIWSRKDGRRIAVNLSLSPIRDASGAVIGVSKIARDVTDCVERLRLACEAARLGMWFWSIDRDRLVWTTLCRRLFGVGTDEGLSYARWIAALHPDDRDRTRAVVARALADHADFSIEHRAVWPDGSVHWISGRGRAYCDEAGKPVRMVGTAIDVTAQKQIEQERARLLEHAEAARAEAQAATRAKDEFLAVVSHELRTPLQSMLGWTQLLKARFPDAPAAQKALAAIDRSVHTQSRLIEDLLDVSRIVAGKLSLASERVDLSDVVAAALESARAVADEKGMLVLAPPGPRCEVIGDPVRLLQVVSNLLTNAVKFTPAGGRLGVKLELEDGRARIVVEDSGRGISPEFLPQVFERFRQSDRTTEHACGGLGLGLAIVQHLVELHGGTVRAESPGEGRGATFTVTLPIAEPEPPASMLVA